MHPHLHVLLPSSTPSVLLEARIYLPHAATSSRLAGVLSMDADSKPQDWKSVDESAVRELDIERIVTAAHPWGRLGGNILFPVIAHHLPAGVFESAPRSAVATFNARGVGLSGGSQPWPGCGIGSDGDDFAAVEKALLALVGDVDVYRLGYSYGTNLALNAPSPPERLRRTMLVAPAPTLFKAMTALRGPTFQQGLDSALDRAGDEKDLWAVFGTKDDFTGVDTLRALGGERGHLIHKVEIEGCGHFFARGEDGRRLREAVAEWIKD